MSTKIHLTQHSLSVCPDYQDFLKRQQQGKEYKLNFLFFFFSPLWLIINKMYSQLFLMIFFYLNLTSFLINVYGSIGENFVLSVACAFIFVHSILTMYSHKLYQMDLENKFHKVNYDIEKCSKIVKPYPYYISIALFFIIPILSLFAFNITYRLLDSIKLFMH